MKQSGGYIPYEDLGIVNRFFREAFVRRFESLLERGSFVLGAEVSAFEEAFAAFNGVEKCASVGCGLDALTLALKTFNFPPGKEVLVPSNTYIATILAVLNCNLRPVLVEPDINTFTIDPARLSDHVSSNTVAVIPVHLYGRCCDMTTILEEARRYGLVVIEDCAQSPGAEHKGIKAGAFGDAAAFSFYPTKNLGALGDGGAVVSNDIKLVEKVKALRNYGSSRKYYNDEIGVNSRLDEIQAAFLSIKLEHLDRINAHKIMLAGVYNAALRPGFIRRPQDADYLDVYHIFNVRHPKRDEVQRYLAGLGIGTEVHYPVAPHRQLALSGMFKGMTFPVSEEIHRTTLSLPVSTAHRREDIERVVSALNQFPES